MRLQRCRVPFATFMTVGSLHVLIRFDRIHERDKQTHTHRQTPHDGRPRLASRGKKISN